MFGFSARHGPHQDAQKSIRTNLPRNEDSAISVPSGAGSFISGATVPVSTNCGWGISERMCLRLSLVKCSLKSLVMRALGKRLLRLWVKAAKKTCSVAGLRMRAANMALGR